MAFGTKRDTRVAWHRVDAASLDLAGRNVAVVGGTGGLGRALSQLMASQGARVIVVGQTFRDAGVPRIEFMKADLSVMREAQRIGEALPAETLDIVIFTTGIFAGPKRETTADGIERDLAVSYLNRLVILNEIAPRLGTARAGGRLKPRVFVMGYPGAGQAGTLDDLNAEKSYKAMPAHMNTVAGNEVLVLDAAERYSNIAVFGLNPGLHKTDIRKNLWGDTLKSRVIEWMIGLFTPGAEKYAQRIVPLLVAPGIETHSGAMFDQKGNAILASPKLTDASYRRAFMEISKTLAARGGVHLA